MAWTLYSVPSAQREGLDAALRDDLVARQSHKLREASAVGGPSGTLYVLVEGAPAAVARAEELLTPLGSKPPAAEAEALYRRFKDEEESASAGMGLFFTE
ncbi:MAG: hypothetical protein L3K13_08445 [Thermoplasmata archaeon]|nr:hypothetical protein [Thermoplasmata archaeon]